MFVTYKRVIIIISTDTLLRSRGFQNILYLIKIHQEFQTKVVNRNEIRVSSFVPVL